MLASRACRSSIMVGRPLDRPQMRRVLDRLAGEGGLGWGLGLGLGLGVGEGVGR